jgi:hypothetical protein
MDHLEARKLLSAQFSQSLAESGVEVTAIPRDQLQAVVDALADGVFAVLDGIEDEAVGPEHPPAAGPVGADPAADLTAEDGAEETLLWRGRPYLTIGIRYELTSQRLRVVRGILGRRLEEIELVRVRDTKIKQHAGERALNVGDITVYSTDPTTPEIVLNNVRHANDVRELIRKTTMAEKNRRGLYYREDL